MRAGNERRATKGRVRGTSTPAGASALPASQAASASAASAPGRCPARQRSSSVARPTSSGSPTQRGTVVSASMGRPRRRLARGTWSTSPRRSRWWSGIRRPSGRWKARPPARGRTVQPPSCSRRWWWWWQRSTRLERLVSPPRAQWTMWWASTNRRWPQPGKRQPPSRAVRARRMCDGTLRVRRPTSSGRPPRVRTGTTLASQTRRRAVSGASGSPSPTSQRPGASARRVSWSTRSRTWWRSPPAPGDGPCSRALSARATSASARTRGGDVAGNVRRCFRPRTTFDLLARCPQRGEDELALLGGEARLEDEGAVVVVVVQQVAARVRAIRTVELRYRAAISADEALELAAGRVTGQLEKVLLELRRGNARQRPCLGRAQPALGEGRADEREVVERARDSHLLARGARADGAAPPEPRRAGATAPRRPTLAAVVLADQEQSPARGRVEVAGEGGYLFLEAFERGRWTIARRTHVRMIRR